MITPDYRLERKLYLSNEDLFNFRHWLISNDAKFSTCYPNRIINNIYFDTPDMERYWENVSGISSRRKCRLRWYGNTFTPTSSQFEIKIKENGLGLKDIHHFDDQDFNLKKVTTLHKQLMSVLPSEFNRELSTCPWSTQYNSYQREYFSTSKDVRLTIDTKLEFLDLRESKNLSRTPRKMTNRNIIEIKYDENCNKHDLEFISQLPYSVTRNSKYVTGIDFTY